MFPYRDRSPQLNTYGVVLPTHFVSVPLLGGGNAGLNFRDAALASPPTPGVVVHWKTRSIHILRSEWQAPP
jgi:hypothetical protein